MFETSSAVVGNNDPARARELAVLVDLEARWENMRKATPSPAAGRLSLPDLQGIQNAYTAFRAKLVAYNKRYKPAHVPELLLNTPTRVGTWCRAMRDLHLQIEQDAQALCPVHLLEKAYRCADRLSALMKTAPVNRAARPATIRDAISELDALAQWCDALSGAAVTA